MKSIKALLGSALLSGLLLSGTSFAEEQPAQATATVVATQTDMQAESAQAVAVGDKLNINTASASEIQKALTGIGAKKAEAIVQYREKHGNFTSAEQLLEVQGIGRATLDKNRDRLAF